jgi:hypothetical protein
MRRIMCASWGLLALVLALPVCSSAATKADFEDIALVIDSLGQPERADQLLAALAAIPDEDFDAIYSGVDLAPLYAEFQRSVGLRNAARDARSRVDTEYRDAIRAAEQTQALMGEPRTGANGPFPDADYPVVLPECPFHLTPDRTSPTRYLIDATVSVDAVRKTLEQVSIALDVAKGVWDGLSRGCEQVEGAIVLGEGAVFNLSLACIPVDIVFEVAAFLVAEAQFGIELAQSYVDLTGQCDGLIDGATLYGNYDRLGHIHDDLNSFKDDVDVRLDNLQADMDLVKQVLLEADMNQRSGSRTSVNYVDRIEEVCGTAQLAIYDAEAAGYVVSPRAQADHDLGQQLIPADPKAAYDLCKRSYRTATVKSTRLR